MRKKIIALTATLILLAVMIPVNAAAATNGTVNVSFSTSNTTPSIGTITTSPTPFTPQQEWTTVTVPVTDSNTLADIDTVKVTLFYDSAGDDRAAPTIADTQTCAIITWTRGSGFSLDAGTGSSWALNTSGSSAGSDSETTGNWVFSFKIGKVATESGTPDDWDICVEVNDGTASDTDYLRDIEMNWYGEVTGLTGSVSWTGVALGVTNATSTNISATYISNGNYSEQIKTDDGSGNAEWDGTGTNKVTLKTSGAPGPGEFSLKADDDNEITDAIQVTTAYQDIAADGTLTGESGATTANNTLWLTLGSTGIPADTYNGKVYFQIANR